MAFRPLFLVALTLFSGLTIPVAASEDNADQKSLGAGFGGNSLQDPIKSPETGKTKDDSGSKGGTESERKWAFDAYQVWTAEELDEFQLPDSCVSALLEGIECDRSIRTFKIPAQRTTLGPEFVTDLVCQRSCGESLAAWFNGVATACAGYEIEHADPTLYGGSMWAGYNETCLKDADTGHIIAEFTPVSSIEEMPKDELCSYCWIERLATMQKSSYSDYDEFLLEYTYKTCGLTGNTTAPRPLVSIPDAADFCLSGNFHTTSSGETCDSIALANNLSSAATYFGNPSIANCSDIPEGTRLCLPPPCTQTYLLQPGDTCFSIERHSNLGVRIPFGAVKLFNRWVNSDCSNLHAPSNAAFGHVLCLGPQVRKFKSSKSGFKGPTTPKAFNGYAEQMTNLPKGAAVAEGTTRYCGRWHVVKGGDTCMSIAYEAGTTMGIFLEVNPSLGKAVAECTDLLEVGMAYCVVPHLSWEYLTSEDVGF
ncbi:hypothetical protein ACJ41O_011519 [Fusarium nematophilum]